jgi:hypothetical protein
LFNPSPQAGEGVAKSASEAQLFQIAGLAGTDIERLVKDAALRLLGQDARFRAAGKHKVPPLRFGRDDIVIAGRHRAGWGEFIEEEEMDARIEWMISF